MFKLLILLLPFAFFSGGSAFATMIKPEIIVTIKPLYALVKVVAGERVDVKLLVTGTASPHGYQLKPSDIGALQKADMILLISKDFETFLAGALEELPAHPQIIEVAHDAEGMWLLPAMRVDQHERHSHHHGRYDLHLWLDIRNAQAIIRLIVQRLSAAYPAYASEFSQRADKAVEELNSLDAELGRRLSPVSNRPYLVFHDAYRYLEEPYDLAYAGTIALRPDVPISARQLSRLRRQIKEDQIACIFSEPQFSNSILTVLTEGMSVKSATLDPLGTAIEANEDFYPTLMLGLANTMQECLKPMHDR